jgi:hypothetical protein
MNPTLSAVFPQSKNTGSGVVLASTALFLLYFCKAALEQQPCTLP